MESDEVEKRTAWLPMVEKLVATPGGPDVIYVCTDDMHTLLAEMIFLTRRI